MTVQQTMNRPSYADATVKIAIGMFAVAALIAVNFGSSEVRRLRKKSVDQTVFIYFISHRIIRIISRERDREARESDRHIETEKQERETYREREARERDNTSYKHRLLYRVCRTSERERERELSHRIIRIISDNSAVSLSFYLSSCRH
jgi:hypothetical protein